MVRTAKQVASQRKAAKASAVARSAKKKITPHQIAKARKNYRFAGQGIGELQRAKQMVPPRGVSGEMHQAVLDDQIAFTRSHNTYKKHMRSLGA
jgi:hypothetical protein